MILGCVLDFPRVEPVILRYESFGYPVFISLEGFSPSGSIKFAPALSMIQDLERRYTQEVLKKRKILESSSGNIAVAMAQICKLRGYRLSIIMDPLASKHVYDIMRLYGVEVIMVTEKDGNGGYLGSRIRKAKELSDGGEYLWTCQYENPANPEGHYVYTAPRLFRDMPDPEYLFIGAGTCGSLVGISRYFKERSPKTKVVAVDVDGSIALGGPPKPRRIPGMGASRVPPHLDMGILDDKIWVSEAETIRMLRTLLDDTGLLFGGSTGTIIAAIREYFKKNGLKPRSVLTVSPDFGDKYVGIYNEMGWVA